MKKLLFVGLAALLWSAGLQASPKHEHRSAWVATVFRLDWPTSYGTTTTVANKQKTESDAYINKLAENNYNAVYFQVRPRADAMYNSAYEPWSSDLTGSRGSTPAWDPLAYWVEKCHAKGMECYAWLNPYRYESSAGSWGNADYRRDHSDWIMEYNSRTILNPGIEGVKQRICDIVYDILSKYDVDGIVFDDYFYIDGSPMSLDQALYNASNSPLSQADWRRENVNEMVRRVYQTIQNYKPWVKFIIGPAGAGHAPASKYGLHGPSCSASDWQYNTIYSEPLAWLYEGTIDAISPQLYWSTTHSTNPFGPLTEWWSYAAETFGRHNYPSHSISSFSSDNSTTAWNDHITMTELTRQYAADQTAGNVLWSAAYACGQKASGYAEYTLQEVYEHPALQPAIDWKTTVTNPGTVGNLTKSGSTLTWSGFNNYRYAVYAVPTSVGKIYTIPSDYLIGNPYDMSFSIPSAYQTGYNYAVSAVDRLGNEFTPIYVGDASGQEQLAAVTLTSPADNSVVNKDTGFTFSWTAISGASYTIEVATSSSFTSPTSRTTSSTSLASTNFTLAYGTTYYWRVVASKTGYTSSTSAIGTFTTDAQVINPGTDPSTYAAVDGYTLQILWLYSVNTNSLPAQLAGDHRGFAYLNGKLYIATRDNGIGSLLEFNATNGQYIRTISLSGDYLHLSGSSSNLGYPCNDVFTDGAGHLCVSNMITSVSATAQLNVCTVDVTTGATTRVFQSALDTASMRFDYMSAIGDVTASGGVLYAATTSSGSENQNRVYRFTRGSGSTWTAAYTTISTYYPSSVSNNGTGARVTAVSNSRFILDGAGYYATFYDFVANGNATIRGNFEQNASIKPVGSYGNGACVGSVNGQPLFAYSYDDVNSGYQFGLATLPSQTTLANSNILWHVPAETLGNTSNPYVSSQPIIVDNGDNTSTLYIYTPLNGIGAYKITYTQSATPNLDAVTLSAPANGATVSLPFTFSWSAISGATYTVEVSRSANFTSLATSKSGLTTNSVSSSQLTLEEGTTYYWRVKAEKSGYNSSLSAVRSFTTAVTPTLDPVTLSTPADGAAVDRNDFTFSWSAINGASYTIELSKNSNFSPIAFTSTTSSTSIASSTFGLEYSTTYYWRVKADKSGYIQSTSAVRSFTTNAAPIVLPTDPATYANSNGFSIESIWLYSENKGNFPSELAGDHRGFAYLNGKLYVSTRADGAGSLLEYDAATLQLNRTIALTGDYLTLSNGNTLQFPCNDVFVDGAGHLCVSSMSITFDTSSQLTVCTVNVSTGATTRVFESNITNSMRIDYASAIGDVTASGGCIFASTSASGTNNQNRVYRWTRSGSTWSMAYTEIASYYPSSASNNGYGSRVKPISTTQFFFDGSSSAATLYTFVANGNATMSANFSQNSDIEPLNNWGNGVAVGSIGGTQLIAYAYDSRSSGGGSQIAIATYPSNSSFASSNLMWQLPQAKLGSVTNSYSTTQPILVDNGDGTGYLYVYAPLNGIGAYKLTNLNYLPDLEAVTLTAPANGENVPDGFTFSWSAITGASYTLEISTSSNFSSVAFTSTTSSTSLSSTPFGLAASTTYYWRVKANKSGYNQSISAVRSFRTADPVYPDLDPVTLNAPANGATVDQTTGFNFSWSAISGATYTVEVASNSTFTSIIGSKTASTNSIASSQFNLVASTTYYWRVTAAKSGYNSSVSAVRSFTTSAPPTLEAVNLLTPANGETVADGFTFTWSAIQGASYTLEIAPQSSFRSITYSSTVYTNSLSSSQFNFDSNSTYYWRVKANKSGYNQSISAVRSFRTPEEVVIIDERPKDQYEYSKSGNLAIDSEFYFTILNGNFPESLGRDQRGMTAIGEHVYVVERRTVDDVTYAYLNEYHWKTGELEREILLTGDCYTLSNGSTLGYPGNDVFVDGAGHLCVSNMAVSFSNSSQLTVCTVNTTTGATTRVFESNISATMRIDYASAYGDVTANGGTIFGATSSVGSSNRDYIYRWTRNAYGEWTMEYTRLRSYYPSQSGQTANNGRGGRVMPIDYNRFIFDSDVAYPTLYNFTNGTRVRLSDSFSNNTSIRPDGRACTGMCAITLQTGSTSTPLFIYSSDDSESDLYRFTIARNPNNYAYSSMSRAWSVPNSGMGKNGNAYLTCQPAAINRPDNNDGSVMLYIYVPYNGLAAYHIYDPDVQFNTGVDEIDDPNAFEIAYDGHEVSTPEIANFAIFTTAGALAITEYDTQKVNITNLTTGVYIVKAVSGARVATRTIVIR